MSSEEKRNWRTLADFSPCSYDDDQTRRIRRKNSASYPFVVKSVLEYKCKLLHDTAYEKTSKQTPDAALGKKLIPTKLAVIFTKHRIKRSVFVFFRVCLSNIWALCPRLVCISPRVNFFSRLHKPETHFLHQQGHQRPRSLIGSTNAIIQKTATALDGEEHQKTVNLKKTWNASSGIQ